MSEEKEVDPKTKALRIAVNYLWLDEAKPRNFHNSLWEDQSDWTTMVGAVCAERFTYGFKRGWSETPRPTHQLRRF